MAAEEETKPETKPLSKAPRQGKWAALRDFISIMAKLFVSNFELFPLLIIKKMPSKIANLFLGSAIYVFLALITSMLMMCYVRTQTKDRNQLQTNTW